MITEEILHKLNPYSTSSWAIWNENDENDLPFFLSRTEKLRNDVVFLGLNRSGIHKLGFGNFQNFHAKGHRGDAELKKLIQDQNLVNLTGAYMTDLSEIFETNSKKVEINTIASGKKLEEQLTLLGSENSRSFVSEAMFLKRLYRFTKPKLTFAMVWISLGSREIFN